jgi:hypothetical protein
MHGLQLQQRRPALTAAAAAYSPSAPDSKDVDLVVSQAGCTKACVFEILQIEQKFTSKLLYEKKFVWVNLSARSIHMSEYNSKERCHKEASLSDVTAVELGVPKKFEEGLAPIADHCLTVVFKRGGGIDLKFDNQNTRDIWAETLTKIVAQINGGSSAL